MRSTTLLRSRRLGAIHRPTSTQIGKGDAVKIPLPNLDDRRWAELVDEGRSLIPLYAPNWTDHNIHDPGITLIELLAWIAEMDIYQLNRIGDEHKRKFLSLIGIAPQPPRPSRTVVGLSLKDGAAPFRLPPATEFSGPDVFGTETRFRTLCGVTVTPGRLQAVQIKDAKDFRDYTDRFDRGLPFGAFGSIPEPGAELYLGMTQAPPVNEWISLYFHFDDVRAGDQERIRIIEEEKARTRGCRPPASEVSCVGRDSTSSTTVEKTVEALSFDRVRLTWEFLADDQQEAKWLALDARTVKDDTRALTLNGSLSLKIPGQMVKKSIGRVEAPLYYIRCRFEAGAYDAPPLIQALVFNGLRVEQSTTVAMDFIIKSGATIEGTEPSPWDLVGLGFELDQQGRITQLTFEAGTETTQFRILDYKKPTSTATGSLTVETALAGKSNGQPDQDIKLNIAPVDQTSLRLVTLEGEEWREWKQQNDFDSARRDSFVYTLDSTDGILRFGDGDRGRVPPEGSLVFVTYRSTRAEAGNVPARSINSLADSPHNRALLKGFDSIKDSLQQIANPIGAAGGGGPESLDEAEARAIDLMNGTERAVTLKDCQELAMRTPGARLARVAALANTHPSFPCFKAPGLITLIILPDMPVPRPNPSAGLKRAVARYLNRRRIIGTRFEVVGPTYLDVAVRAQVKALSAVSKASLQSNVSDALSRFLDPLKGGPDKTGWPFGRDVYRSEIMQIIDEVPGVDHVLSLELIAGHCEPQCGNVCLGPTWLVVSGQHEIEVI